MIEVFKTNINCPSQSAMLIEKLLEHYPEGKINFDLDDCDKILRVECEDICAEKIMEIVNSTGFDCEVLI